MEPMSRRAAIVVAATGTSALLPGQIHAAVKSKKIATEAMPDYSSQNRVEGLTIPKRVAVIGTGGFGCWPALIAALSGVDHLVLIDASDVDALDLARSPFKPSDIGRPKAQALANFIKSLRPQASVSWEKRYITEKDTDMFAVEVIFDGANSVNLSKYLASESKRRGVRYVQGFYNGLSVGTSDDFVPGLNFQRGEPVPVWGGSAVFAGALAAISAFSRPINFFADVSSISTGAKLVLSQEKDGDK